MGVGVQKNFEAAGRAITWGLIDKRPLTHNQLPKLPCDSKLGDPTQIGNNRYLARHLHSIGQINSLSMVKYICDNYLKHVACCRSHHRLGRVNAAPVRRLTTAGMRSQSSNQECLFSRSEQAAQTAQYSTKWLQTRWRQRTVNSQAKHDPSHMSSPTRAALSPSQSSRS